MPLIEPKDWPSAVMRAPGALKPSFMRRATAPPSAFSPKGAFAPGVTSARSIAKLGMLDQCTVSPNGSLMRCPSWYTAIPCGLPSTGDAV